MSRGNSITIWRPAAVWLAVTAGALAAAREAPEAWHAVATTAAYDSVVAVLVAACTTGLALALTWLWLVTTVTVLGLLTGRAERPGRPGGATRRLVLLACGAAVVAGVAGTSVPAVASGGDGRDLLVGLTLPERAVAPAQLDRPAQVEVPARTSAAGAAATAAPEAYVVRPGDSLWSIARDHPGGPASVDQRWRAIWQANRDVVGDDPDLILPGQALRLPTTPHSDGDR